MPGTYLNDSAHFVLTLHFHLAGLQEFAQRWHGDYMRIRCVDARTIGYDAGRGHAIEHLLLRAFRIGVFGFQWTVSRQKTCSVAETLTLINYIHLNVSFVLPAYSVFIIHVQLFYSEYLRIVKQKNLPILRAPDAAHSSGALRLFSEFNFLLLFLVTASWSNKSRKSFLINRLHKPPMYGRTHVREKGRAEKNVFVRGFSLEHTSHTINRFGSVQDADG